MILIVCPAYSETGGPESLHMLYQFLNKKRLDVSMFYFNLKDNNVNPVPKKYDKYDVRWVTSLDDKQDNVIIFPEVYAHKALGFKKADVYIWWLSYDNYYNFGVDKNRVLGINFKRIIKLNFKFPLRLIMHLKLIKNTRIRHLAGTHYVKFELEKLGIEKIDFLNQTMVWQPFFKQFLYGVLHSVIYRASIVERPMQSMMVEPVNVII